METICIKIFALKYVNTYIKTLEREYLLCSRIYCEFTRYLSIYWENIFSIKNSVVYNKGALKVSTVSKLLTTRCTFKADYRLFCEKSETTLENINGSIRVS